MKTRQTIHLLVGLIASAGFVSPSFAATKAPENVSVSFEDADNFTDVRESHSNFPSDYFLQELRKEVQESATPRLPVGSKLSVTFLDVDLAGDIRPDKNYVRFMTSTTIPRARLKFQLTDADGKVLQEGERRLLDMNYQDNISLRNRSDPLIYDKEMLRNWVQKEFRKKA